MAHDEWDAIIAGARQDSAAGAARLALEAASGLYRAGLAANHWVYDSGLRPRTRAHMPVISIGNLTLGGTGKTTAAAYVARMVLRTTVPGIVLRGYRRRAAEGPLIVSDAEAILVGTEQSGDEAQMLARMLPRCAVAVGKRREQVIQALWDRTPARVAILDDGLQYFRMARDLEIVLVDALADPRALRLFPAGRLREPLANLRRAHQVWLTHSDLVGEERLAELEACVREHCPDGVIARARHRTGALTSLDGRPAPRSLKGLRVVAFSGLGSPESFELAVAREGASVRAIRFDDHHAYCADDLELVAARASAAGADLIVTTAKDAVKLPGVPPGTIPTATLGCEMRLTVGAQSVAAQVMRVCDA